MVKWLKQVFRLRTILVVFTVAGLLVLLLSYFAPFVHPKTASFLPLLGLGYWVILIGVLVLLVIWTIMKSRWALVVLLFLLLGGKLHFRTFTFGSDEVNENGTELRIMSYNVRLFDLYNANPEESIGTKDKIFKYLKERNPDVVCFQEFYHQDAPTKFITRDTLTSILGSVDFHERYAHKLAGRQNFGIALFSKYPIIEKGNVAFPVAHSNFNYCIYADIVKNNDTIRVYNVHLQSISLQKDDYALFDEKNVASAEESSNAVKLIHKINQAFPVRAEQAAVIMEHVRNSPYKAVVCGDFNDTPLSYCYNQFNQILVDAYRNTSKGIGTTYAGRIPVGRIDYIFHSLKLGSKDFVIQQEALSDHYAIDCTIFVKPEE